MELQKINERFPGWENGGGIFFKIYQLNKTYRPEWLATTEHAMTLDRMYHGRHSFDKIESKLSYILFTNFEKDSYKYLTSDIISQFSLKWEKLYATLHFDYNPIWNVEGTEERTITRKLNQDKNETTNINRETNVVSDNTNNSTYGFNSSDPVPSGKTEHTGAQNETEGNNFIATNVNNETVTDRFTRGGNIGVTTTQKMISEERDSWLWNFYEQVFKDIDSILTSAYWG